MEKMMRLLSLLFFMGVLTAWGDGPESTAKTFFEEVFTGDIDKVVALMYIPPEAKQMGLNEASTKNVFTVFVAGLPRKPKLP
ncbi:MAG: hypothetical protein Q4A74_08465, partial [Cardiobacteriaceae bacterium]|nr:hypothetical protein [Cardiobacteriaceae bacterium]